jgi:hypothetical protein
MLANGIGVRQLATRSALYSDAKELRSADVVPGMPLGSDAPGAPAVEPPMADGHTGAAGGGVGVGVTSTATGVLVKVRPLTSLLVVVVVNDFVPGVAALDDEDEDDCADPGAVADPEDVAVWLPVSTAAIADLLSEELDGAEAELLAAIVTLLACEMDGIEEPGP